MPAAAAIPRNAVTAVRRAFSSDREMSFDVERAVRAARCIPVSYCAELIPRTTRRAPTTAEICASYFQKPGSGVFAPLMKRCPLCAADCPPEAVVCQHCRHYFTPTEDRAAMRNWHVRRLFKIAAVVFFIVFTFDMLGGPEGLGGFMGELSRPQ